MPSVALLRFAPPRTLHAFYLCVDVLRAANNKDARTGTTYAWVCVCVRVCVTKPVCLMGLRVKFILCKCEEQKATVDEAGKACEGGSRQGWGKGQGV